MRGLDHLQIILDKLPADDPSCRDAWCGHWERCNGVYEPHTPDDHGCDPGVEMYDEGMGS